MYPRTQGGEPTATPPPHATWSRADMVLAVESKEAALHLSLTQVQRIKQVRGCVGCMSVA